MVPNSNTYRLGVTHRSRFPRPQVFSENKKIAFEFGNLGSSSLCHRGGKTENDVKRCPLKNDASSKWNYDK